MMKKLIATRSVAEQRKLPGVFGVASMLRRLVRKHCQAIASDHSAAACHSSKQALSTILLLLSIAIAVHGESPLDQQNETKIGDDVVLSSYYVGVEIGEGFARDGLSIDIDAFLEGFRERAEGKPSRISKEELPEVLAKLQRATENGGQELRQRNEARTATKMKSNLRVEGVEQTASGAQYRIVRAGNGESIPSTATAVCQIQSAHGFSGRKVKLFGMQGTMWQRSFTEEGRSGLDEIVKLMERGSIFELWLPSELLGRDDVVGLAPGEGLVVRLELTTWHTSTPIATPEP